MLLERSGNGIRRTEAPHPSSVTPALQHPDYYLPHYMRKGSETYFSKPMRTWDFMRRLATSSYLACRTLHAHARPCSSVLRTGGLQSDAIKQMGELLEIPRRATLAASE